jgi:hypothetical protein
VPFTAISKMSWSSRKEIGVMNDKPAEHYLCRAPLIPAPSSATAMQLYCSRQSISMSWRIGSPSCPWQQSQGSGHQKWTLGADNPVDRGYHMICVPEDKMNGRVPALTASSIIPCTTEGALLSGRANMRQGEGNRRSSTLLLVGYLGTGLWWKS